MSKFSDYINDSDMRETATDKTKSDYQYMIDKYSKLSSNELMQEFIKLTAKEKSAGHLSDKKLNGIKDTLKPYLNSEQVSSLDNIINMVKRC